MIDSVANKRPQSKNSVPRPIRLKKMLFVKDKAPIVVRHQKASSFQLDELILNHDAHIERKLQARSPFQDLTNHTQLKSVTPGGFVPCKLLPPNPLLLQARKQFQALAQFPSSKQNAILMFERALLKNSSTGVKHRSLLVSRSALSYPHIAKLEGKRELRAALANRKATEENMISLYNTHKFEQHGILRTLHTRLANWMCECSVVMNLSPRIFPLSVALLDLYLTKCSSMRSCQHDIHPLGIVSMWIASKVESQNHLRTEEIFCKIGHAKFSRKYLQDRQAQFLKEIDFNVSFSLAYDHLYYLLKLLQKAFQESKDINLNCFYSLAYLCLTNYISAIMISNVSENFTQKEIAVLCMITAILKYSPEVLQQLFLCSSTMHLLESEINEVIECDLRDLKKAEQNPKLKNFGLFQTILNRYLMEGTIETKWIGGLIQKCLVMLSGPNKATIDCAFSPM